ncbi:hypothetical protein JCM10213_002691 [Rhodosporidiobolus nylandii]
MGGTPKRVTSSSPVAPKGPRRSPIVASGSSSRGSPKGAKRPGAGDESTSSGGGGSDDEEEAEDEYEGQSTSEEEPLSKAPTPKKDGAAGSKKRGKKVVAETSPAATSAPKASSTRKPLKKPVSGSSAFANAGDPFEAEEDDASTSDERPSASAPGKKQAVKARRKRPAAREGEDGSGGEEQPKKKKAKKATKEEEPAPPYPQNPDEETSEDDGMPFKGPLVISPTMQLPHKWGCTRCRKSRKTGIVCTLAYPPRDYDTCSNCVASNHPGDCSLRKTGVAIDKLREPADGQPISKLGTQGDEKVFKKHLVTVYRRHGPHEYDKSAKAADKTVPRARVPTDERDGYKRVGARKTRSGNTGERDTSARRSPRFSGPGGEDGAGQKDEGGEKERKGKGRKESGSTSEMANAAPEDGDFEIKPFAFGSAFDPQRPLFNPASTAASEKEIDLELDDDAYQIEVDLADPFPLSGDKPSLGLSQGGRASLSHSDAKPLFAESPNLTVEVSDAAFEDLVAIQGACDGAYDQLELAAVAATASGAKGKKTTKRKRVAAPRAGEDERDERVISLASAQETVETLASQLVPYVANALYRAENRDFGAGEDDAPAAMVTSVERDDDDIWQIEGIWMQRGIGRKTATRFEAQGFVVEVSGFDLQTPLEKITALVPNRHEVVFSCFRQSESGERVARITLSRHREADEVTEIINNTTLGDNVLQAAHSARTSPVSPANVRSSPPSRDSPPVVPAVPPARGESGTPPRMWHVEPVASPDEGDEAGSEAIATGEDGGHATEKKDKVEKMGLETAQVGDEVAAKEGGDGDVSAEK